MSKIKSLSISGFKSIRRLENFQLRDLNVLIGANGAGKSNFVSFFQMLRVLVTNNLQSWTSKQGGANRVLSYGIKESMRLESMLQFDEDRYEFRLEPTVNDRLVFSSESVSSWDRESNARAEFSSEVHGYESSLILSNSLEIPSRVHATIFQSCVFHFHDTTETAGVKRQGSLHDNEYLRSDGSNLAAFLYRLNNEAATVYDQIRKTVQLAIPFFDDFVLRPQSLPTGEQQITLLWRQKDSDYPFWPSQLSDGSIRFICLATALLQPDPRSIIIIDEPELGLHPYAITLLGSLLKSASKRMQVIVSTQSVPLVNQFSIDDLIIVEREDGASVFKRHNEIDYQQWLEDYSVGELWEKNILGGRPPK